MCYCNRGYCYTQQGEKAEAISDLEKCIAVSHDPGLIEATNDMLQDLRQ
jgi:tetratricopeptide (TPR) repeat protein